MQLISIFGTTLKPSAICLGCGSFGSAISESESFAMLDAFAQSGGNFADTAHVYAAWLPGGAGQSERTLGKWLADRRPQGFLVSTKGGHPDLGSMEISRLAPQDIARDLEESLERLQLDAVDFYWLHRDDERIPVAEILDALQPHVKAGKVRALGASNWSVARIVEANAEAARRGWMGFCASQIGWSLAQVNHGARGIGGMMWMDDATLAWHRASGFALIAYSSQGNGFFAHPIASSSEEMTDKQKALAPTYGNAENARRHHRARELGAALGRAPQEVALAYVWSQKFPAVAVIGPRNLEQVGESLRAADLRLSDEQVAWLEGE